MTQKFHPNRQKSHLNAFKSSFRNDNKSRFIASSNNAHNGIMFLQRTLGNRVVGQLLQYDQLRAKLQIGDQNDKHEQEAERIAGEVANMTNSITNLAKKNNNTESLHQDSKCSLLNNPLSSNESIVSKDIESKIRCASGKGQQLSETELSYFESRFGIKFDQVRIHNSSHANNLAKSFNARAFTVGNDVFFRAGQYAPKSYRGKKLIAHELCHTLQQSGTYPQSTHFVRLQLDSSVSHIPKEAYLVEQYPYRKSIGPIDQDTGNCTLGAKLINLKLMNILNTGVTLDQVVTAFYAKSPEQIDTTSESKSIKLVYGSLKYRRRDKCAKSKYEVRKTKIRSYETAFWGFGENVSEGSVYCRPVYKLNKKTNEIQRHGYMVMTEEYGGEFTFHFEPKTKRVSRQRINYKIIRNASSTTALRSFLKYLKKNLAGSVLISFEEIKQLSVKRRKGNELEEGKSYVAANPYHFNAIHVTKRTDTTIEYDVYDPLSDHPYAQSSDLDEFEKKNFYEYIK